ncbi:MAG TPA: metal-dependent hydrolase [Saprospiraceae bacterium]|nr:metal-dependent hydrolase [Saprospiraceae bacterium]
MSAIIAGGFVIMSALMLVQWGSWFRWPFFLMIAGAVVFSLYQLYKNYLQTQLFAVHLSYWGWYALFFWSIITHTLLDCFTTYGTQIWYPFNSVRVAWNSISVIDPLYTIPLMICLIVSAFYVRKSQKRRRWNYLGLGLSTYYLIFTLINKQFINRVAEKTMNEQEIVFHRYMTTPTLFNNVLWSATIDAGDTIYTGLYSLWDREKNFKLHGVPRNLHLNSEVSHKSEYKTLAWFTDEYYTLAYTDEGFIQLNDLRYGTIDGERPGDKNFVFSFVIKELPEGKKDFTMKSGRPSETERNKYMQRLFSRMKGI